jgi:integrase
VASVWIRTRRTAAGAKRFRVEYRTGGRDLPIRYGGSFKTQREALERKKAIAGELAALRKPEELLARARSAERDTNRVTFAAAAERWLASRLDNADGTRIQHRTSVGRAVRVLGSRPVDAITAPDVAAMVAELAAEHKPSYVRKVVQATAMVFDHARVDPNPARDKLIVRMPRSERPHVQPPTAEHVQAVHRLLPTRYRLPLLVLDATGMRLGELEQLTWGDVDELRGRWRVTAAVSKTSRARWVTVPPVVFAAVLDLCARDDRTPERRVFQAFGGDRFRTAVTRACTAAGVPTFSPHDLRHRRISLLHLGGVPWARIGEHVGQRDIATTANTYSHTLVDETELDYPSLLT